MSTTTTPAVPQTPAAAPQEERKVPVLPRLRGLATLAADTRGARHGSATLGAGLAQPKRST